MRLPAGHFFGHARTERATDSFAFVERTPELREHEVPTHTHDEAHFIFVIRGLYITESYGAPDLCSTASLVFNPRGTTHRDRFRSDDGVFFTVGVDAQLAATLERALPRATFFRTPTVVRAMSRAYRAYVDGGACSNAILESLGLELAGHATSHTIVDDAQPPQWLLRARDFLRDTNPPPKVSDAANVAGVHPVHLARAFRRYFACSPGEYLRECRIERAKELLAREKHTLAEVALTAGFCDQAEMTHTFRHTLGWTPREFRVLAR